MTVEEFLKLPSPKSGRHEPHHGEAIRTPPPQWQHQITQDDIVTIFKQIAGDAWKVMPEMAFRPGPEYEVWQVDVGVLRVERATAARGYLAGAPEIVIEVLSPSSTMDEINDRMAICMDNGCLSFWIVDKTPAGLRYRRKYHEALLRLRSLSLS